MPANLPPDYYKLEKEHKEAKTYEEKITILKKMLSIMPKHKGTDKLRSDIRGKISKLNRLILKQPSKKETHPFSHIKKEGAGQVILIGKPNSGKSQMISHLTNAPSPSTEYPYATRKPIVGMMEFEDIKIQLIDTPSIAKGVMEKWLPQLIKEADGVLLVTDLGENKILEDLEEVIELLSGYGILLGNYNKGGLPLELSSGIYHKRSLLIGNKNDLEGAEERFRILKDLYEERFLTLSISALKKQWGDLKKEIFSSLDIIRIYTKEPGKPFKGGEPFVMKKNSNVYEAGLSIHKDFRDLKYARLWNDGEYTGQRIERTHILKDKNKIEFHL